MRFNKTVKALAIVLPIMALSACSSSDSASEDTSAMQKNEAAMAEQKAVSYTHLTLPTSDLV